MADQGAALEVFVRVVDEGSFTAAAKALGVSTSHVSRRVKMLEEDLGVRLLERTTRSVRATDVGRRYRDRVAPLLEGLDEAAREARSLQAAPRGVLRVAAPLAFGLRYLGPELSRFLALWPELEIEVDYSDRAVDLVGDGYDLAIRGGRLGDENIVARRLIGIRGVVVASPDYVARCGRPHRVEDLLEHDCLVNTGLRSMPGWAFGRGDAQQTLAVRGRFRSDSGDAIVQAAESGLGIAYEPGFLTADAIAAGRLLPLLEDVPTYEAAFYGMYPHRRHLPAKVRLLLDHLVASWSEPPWSGH